MTPETERLHQLNAELTAQRDEARAQADRLMVAATKENDEVCQILGRILGYPWYCDDQANFPGATADDGVCVGDHVGASLADEAVRRIQRLTAERDKAQADVERLVEGCVTELVSRNTSEWFWSVHRRTGFAATKELACAAVRRAAGLDEGRGDAAN